ncbi:MAG: endonuclease III [Candidatus Aenigmarchaeota archaeon]|nr:endonuclease III [Candidatus Aenigmarchaeota archaeon]
MAGKSRICNVIEILFKYTEKYSLPVAELSKEWRADPFRILITVMISSRTKDEITAAAARRLFSRAPQPDEIERMGLPEIEALITPVNFYKTKAKRVKEISARVRMDFKGKVPDTIEGLVTLPGIGRKTANIVVNAAFGKKSIGVDTHVHRIMNRLGAVQTKIPLETEMALRKLIPESHWDLINVPFVLFGQNVCTPLSPFCSRCPVEKYCSRAGVKKSR